MNRNLLIVCLVGTCLGCTAKALDRRTVNQSLSMSDARYQQILDNLAVVANDPGTIPSFGVVSGGQTMVTDQYGFDPMTNFDPTGFTKQALSLSGKRTPNQFWTFALVAESPQLEAVHCACLWVVLGPPPPGSPAAELLRPLYRYDDNKCHFGVDDRLARLPPNWLGRGRHCEFPADACFRAHCCDMSVWVTRENRWALSEFTLVILDIATAAPVPGSIIWVPPVATVDSMTTPPSATKGQSPCDVQCNCGIPITSATATVTEQRPIYQCNDAPKSIIIPSPPDTNALPAFCFKGASAGAIADTKKSIHQKENDIRTYGAIRTPEADRKAGVARAELEQLQNGYEAMQSQAAAANQQVAPSYSPQLLIDTPKLRSLQSQGFFVPQNR